MPLTFSIYQLCVIYISSDVIPFPDLRLKVCGWVNKSGNSPNVDQFLLVKLQW